MYYCEFYILPTHDGFSAFQPEETQTKIQSLEQQVSCMEDELSEARLEASKLKTELISERSAWEVKLSELQSHVNEVVLLYFY
jgi:chromosome segregation ATPase